MKRAMLLMVGWLCVALAITGAVLPVVPCTPFVLLAAACFARSSTRAMDRLQSSPLLGPVLRDWQQHRGMRPGAKIVAVLIAIAAPLVTFALYPQLSASLLISIAGGLVAIGVVGWLPTIRRSERTTTAEKTEELQKKSRIAA